MSPFKSIKGRALGKLLEGYKSSDIGKGFGAGGGSGPAVATGGTKITDGNYIIHKFTRSNSPEQFVVENGDLDNVEILSVGGGGGCGYDTGGGGGGGGIAYFATVTMRMGVYTFNIGEGGAPGTTGGDLGTNGGNTTLLVPSPSGSYVTITAAGGGGGGTWPSPGNGNPGGSGGGGGQYGNKPGGNATQPGLNTGVSFGGFNQYGSSGGSSGPSSHGSGGGGGADANGSPGSPGNQVSGGSGKNYDISGTTYMYAHGGYGNSDHGAVRPPTQYFNENPKNADPSGSGNGANGSGTGTSYPPGDDGIIYVKYAAV